MARRLARPSLVEAHAGLTQSFEQTRSWVASNVGRWQGSRDDHWGHMGVGDNWGP